MTAKKSTKKATAKKAAAKAPEVVEAQHPALLGEPGVEVASRGADTHEDSTDTHRKEYVVLASDFANANDDFHLANLEAARSSMIGQGLRPTGDGEFAGSEEHADGVNVSLFYDVPAEPAIVSHTEAHVTLDDQHAADEK